MDIDSTEPPVDSKGANKKGRRAKQAADIDVVDKEETPSKLTKSNTSISNNIGEEAGAKQGWGAESTGRTSTSRRNRDANNYFDTSSSQKKTVVGANSGDGDGIADLIDDIPDMEEMAAEQVDIAAAPMMRSSNVVKTVEELENEMNNSSYTINQMQISTIQGLDLSLLISNAMVPIEHLEEEDAKWEWDVVFNQIVTTK